MRFYNYIFSRNLKAFHVGYSANILKAITEYKRFPGMVWPPQHNLLIFLQQQPNEDEARCRLEEITSMSHSDKIKLIEQTNPDLMDLQPGKNITL